MQLKRVAAAVCALLFLMRPSPSPAQTETAVPILHPAWIADRDQGNVVIYVEDGFWRSSSKSSASLHVITLQRSNPGSAVNSVAADIHNLQLYLNSRTKVRATDIVAIASSRDLIRFFFRSDDQAFLSSFQYSRGDLHEIAPEDWERLRTIGLPDFAHYLAKRAVVQGDVERQLLGRNVPPVEQRILQLRLSIQANSRNDAETFASLLKQEHFDAPAPEISISTEDTKVQLLAHFTFSEERVQHLMLEICADASNHAAQCVDWGAKFDTIRVKL